MQYVECVVPGVPHGSKSKKTISYQLVGTLICIWLTTGCSTSRIVSLEPQVSPRTPNISHRVEEVIGIEQMRVGEDNAYDDAGFWQKGLTEALCTEGGFISVTYPYCSGDDVDLVLRGEVSGDFRNRGFLNFITWWPGPIFFAHSWRGTRFIYDVRADVELVDANLGKVLGRYHAENSHALIHRSYNPVGPMLGTILVIPGIVRGIMNTWPRREYRRRMYEEAFPDLWEKIAVSIAKSQAQRYAQRVNSIRERCGERIDEQPVVGTTWLEFMSCQTHRFTLLGQESSAAGTVSVYTNKDRSLRIDVVDGRIVRWGNAKKPDFGR